MLPIHEQLSKLYSNKTQMDFDSSSLYPSAMWDEKLVFPKIETGYAFKPHTKNIYVKAFNYQFFNQGGKESATLRTKHNNPRDPIFQHLPVKGKFRNIEVIGMRNRYIIDILTTVDSKKTRESWRKSGSSLRRCYSLRKL